LVVTGLKTKRGRPPGWKKVGCGTIAGVTRRGLPRKTVGTTHVGTENKKISCVTNGPTAKKGEVSVQGRPGDLKKGPRNVRLNENTGMTPLRRRKYHGEVKKSKGNRVFCKGK